MVWASWLSGIDVSTWALLMAIGMVIGSICGSALHGLGRSMYYDDSPAMIVYGPRLLSTTLKPGEAVQYTFSGYDRREDCTPPSGRAEVAYKLWTYPDASSPFWQWIDYARPSRAKAGLNMQLDGPSTVPLPKLQPGRYALQYVGTYTCAKASRDQVIEGATLPFRVAE